MADDRSTNRDPQPGQSDMPRGESDERIRGVGDEDTDEFEDTETNEEDEGEGEGEEDEGSV
jgi:hypothetical protein